MSEKIRGIPSQQDNSTEQISNHFSTVNLLLASKMPSLDEIPFTQAGFANVMSNMKIHGSIVRAINRNTSCTFASLPYNWPCNDSTVPSIGSYLL